MENQAMEFNARSIRIGMITMICGVIANFIPAVYLYVVYGVIPPVADILKVWMVAAVTFGVSWIIQPITFFSLLGVSGTYIGWLAGSCADIRCPAVAMAQKAAGVEAGTPEGDVISTMGLAGSIFTSVAIITFFTILGMGLIEMLPLAVKSSFKYILPAVFGAVYVQLAGKNLSLGAMAIIVGFLIAILFKIMAFPGWMMNILIIVSAMLLARIQFVYKSKKQA
ncbi:membrane protein [Megasphaera cerevisiae DSM 20462]|uniref:Membrane protein n=1 Tax=Megasphaera cerevisiae DSM 20462 TaxID=1122219 RepID=A0A0J6WQ71_9FIRM|nr:hypothetical protein [Megasphaera cerevisiae]KMO85535.1 membrane protein [Megasphaera cerevisiae DSM 20462]SJZ74657.1 hypothetical protein SAMN05660900_01338 [Megasphaera cerevisiae DSM 20462]